MMPHSLSRLPLTGCSLLSQSVLQSRAVQKCMATLTTSTGSGNYSHSPERLKHTRGGRGARMFETSPRGWRGRSLAGDEGALTAL